MIGAITAGLYGTGVPPVTSSYESIQTVTLGSSQSTITFSSIPSTYKHLQLRATARDGGGANDTSSYKIVFNSDTSSTYTRHFIFGTGAAASAGFNQTTGFAFTGSIAQNGMTANTFGATVIDILDYQNTNKYKTLRNLAGTDANGSGSLIFSSSLWQSTSAINSISLTSFSGSNFLTNTKVALYGIKG